MKKIIISILIIFLGMFLYSAYTLLTIHIQYKKASDEYVSLKQDVRNITEEEKTEDKGTPCSIRFDKLKRKNSDIVGWITIPDTRIDYPICRGVDNSFYLKHSFLKKPSVSGCIFSDSALDGVEFQVQNTILYGHNMKDGSMFKGIRLYQSQKFYKKHSKIEIQIPGEKNVRIYEVASAYITDCYSNTYSFDCSKKYLKRIQRKSLIQTNQELFNDYSDEDEWILLSTCTSRTENERFVVHAKRIA